LQFPIQNLRPKSKHAYFGRKGFVWSFWGQTIRCVQIKLNFHTILSQFRLFSGQKRDLNLKTSLVPVYGKSVVHQTLIFGNRKAQNGNI